MENGDKARRVLSYYFRHVRAYPLYLIGAILSVPITVFLNSYLPYLILASVLSRLSQHQYTAGHIWSSFSSPLLLYAAVLFMGLFAWRVVDFFVWRMEAKMNRAMAEEVLDHLINETTDFHANNFTGSLVSQTNKLIGSYVRASDATIYQTYPLFVGILITCAVLAHRAPLFVLMLLIFCAVFIYTSFKISKPIRNLSSKHATAESQQTGYLADAITNVIAIKSFSRTSFERQRFQKATSASEKSLMAFAKAHQLQMNYLGTLTRSMGSLALLFAVIGVMVLKMDIATVFLIFTYTAGIVDQLFNFGNNGLRNYNRSIGDAYDMVNILSKEPLVKDPADPEIPKIKSGEIVFDNVTFGHSTDASDQTKPLFKNFDLRIEPGEKVGLVGHSGGGKTTLTKLILRFMDLSGGAICIDGQNIAAIAQDDLRRFITYVPQEPMLFHRSLEENISYGQINASKKDILKVAQMAHAHEFIKDLPSGYETLVGERGVKLSGGQRQRIAIARAMIKDAPILILDEATSALDSESEKLIQDALWKLMEGRTAIVIAHRLSTVQKMDRIVVLEDGKIAEQGTHKELIENKGIYSSLWAHQSGGFLED